MDKQQFQLASQQLQQSSDNGLVLVLLAMIGSATFIPGLIKLAGLIINFFKSKSDKSIQSEKDRNEALEKENRQLRSEKDKDHAAIKKEMEELRTNYFNLREDLIDLKGTVTALDNENSRLKKDNIQLEKALEHAKNEAKNWKDKYTQLQLEHHQINSRGETL